MTITNIGRKLLQFTRPWIGEVIIILGFLVIVKQFIGIPETTITADGVGYYDYLPSVFIRGDLSRKDLDPKKDSIQFREIINKGTYVPYKGKFVNKYPCGVALLESPFFLFTSPKDVKIPSGYEPEFHKSVYYAAIVYLFLGLLILKGLLLLYSVKRWAVFLIQCGIGLGTNLTFYVVHDSAFSHVYSFFAVVSFLYMAKRYFDEGKLKWLLWAAACFGLVILIRQINCIVLFTLPFLAGSWPVFKERILQILRKPIWIGSFTAIVLLLFSIQCIAWYQQTGHWLIYSYQGEYFDFTKPEIVNVLFSYRRGLFVYTPLLLVAVIAGIYFAVKRDWFRFYSFTLFFALYTYVISSWWAWMYGCSFGHRAFVDFYPFFILPLALLIDRVNWKISVPLFSGIMYAVIYLNVVQIYQYKYFIIDWMDMNREKYWLVFLETDKRFNGLVWKEKPDSKTIGLLQQQSCGSLYVPKGVFLPIVQFNDSTGHFPIQELNYIHMRFGNAFHYDDSSSVVISIIDTVTKASVYYDDRFAIHFQEKGLGKEQTGNYWYKLPDLPSSGTYKLEIHYFAKKDSYLRDLKVGYFRKK